MYELTKIDSYIYRPSFDINKGIYIDKSPYKPYERNRITYECRCCAGKSFTNNTQFKSHIKSQTHKEFVKNYPKYYKEVDEATDTIKKQKITIEQLNNDLNKINKNYLKLKTYLENLSTDDDIL